MMMLLPDAHGDQTVCTCRSCGRVLVLSRKADRQVRGAASREATFIVVHPIMVISLAPHVQYTQPLTQTPCYLPYCAHTSLSLSASAVAAQAVGSSPCRWKLSEEAKSTGMKTAVSFLRKRSALQGAAAAAASPWQRRGEHEVLGVRVSRLLNLFMF